ncbi:hypothetical protein KPL78_16410 [Roseomonas sp. HJA6]|uniref:Uncharacterized protein n=1 Tax=Roseomonas alba TaxID=2846776 RepID=A0ABS7AAY6_9PROT|nr:hypothetical protein [Neoroseomonas alba]MBW6399442.1 hypothetical protein [Neoroseomonas alba]
MITIDTRAPRAIPARSGTSIPPQAATRPGTGLSPAEIRQIILEILG